MYADATHAYYAEKALGAVANGLISVKRCNMKITLLHK
jgi:hypothetical protein